MCVDILGNVSARFLFSRDFRFGEPVLGGAEREVEVLSVGDKKDVLCHEF